MAAVHPGSYVSEGALEALFGNGNGTDIGFNKTGAQIHGFINLGSDHICIIFLVLFKLQQYVIIFEWLRHNKV